MASQPDARPILSRLPYAVLKKFATVHRETREGWPLLTVETEENYIT